MTPEEKAEKQLDVSIQTRNVEIELFWKRSLFFWGFIAAAFVGYAALRQANSDLALVIACFGMVCAFAWALLNRGSKYWQESWERKVERYEICVTGKLFAQEEDIQTNKGCWLQARKYSVSKISIALSDYVFVLWLSVVTGELFRRYAPLAVQPWLKEFGLNLFVFFSLIFLVLLLIFGRSSTTPHLTLR
jgi:hypothetical protein